MGLHIKTIGCNGRCRSCYENRIRSVNLDTGYDIEAMIKTLEEETAKIPKNKRDSTVCLHGGEPLMMKFEDVERLLKKIHELYGYTNVQTNGTLITDAHIELFKKYKTSVGVSIDGDTAQLNYGRWNMPDRNSNLLSMEQVQKVTDKTIKNMRKVYDAKIGLSIIALLRRYNADEEHIDDFIRFLLRMRNEFGVVHVRTNEAIVYEEEYQAEEQLTIEEMGKALCKIADVVLGDPELCWLPYRDIVNMMMGYTNETTCVFSLCDVWKTGSEKTIMIDGSLGSCLKGGAALDGLQILRYDGKYGNERYTMLQQVPQEYNGCKDCRYWWMCRGGCPGEGVDNDWRNRTRFCSALRMLFLHIEKKIRGLIPNIYTLPMFSPHHPTPSLVQHSLGDNGSTWRESKRRNIEEMKKEIAQGEKKGIDPFHGDSAYQDKAHGDSHGDAPHGDSHGDKHADSGAGHNDEHGDEHKDQFTKEPEHSDRDHGDEEHGDRAHGDSPHGDSHADSHADSGTGGHGDRPHGDS